MGCSSCGKNKSSFHLNKQFNLLTAIGQSAKVIVGLADEKDIYVSEEKRQERIFICENCPSNRNYLDINRKLRCNLCDCFMKTKARYKDAKCLASKESGDPEGPYWTEEE